MFKFKTIRLRFLAGHIFVLAITLLLLGLILYSYYRHLLLVRFDDILESKADTIVSSIDTYWEVEKMEALKDGIKGPVLFKAGNKNFIKIAGRWVENRSDDPDLMNLVVQIFDVKGRLIASSKYLGDGIPLSLDAPSELIKKKRYFSSFEIDTGNGHIMPFRSFSRPVMEQNKLIYIVQISGPQTTLYGSLKRLKLVLMFLLPLTLIVASTTTSAFLANLILLPLKHMIETVQKITVENMGLRVKVPKGNDEISQLARTFNLMLEELDRSFSKERQFLQDFSHELRTPLTIIRGEIEVLLKQERQAHEYKQVLLSNLEEISRITQIVEKMLTLARLENKELGLDIEDVDVGAFIGKIVRDMRIVADQKKITMKFEGEDEIHALIDKKKILRVLLNLIDNAIKYTGDDGVINISAKALDENFIQIQISDTGVGIDEKSLPFIFDRFYRVDPARSSDGFGLGLSIVKSIVKAHHGEISVQSRLGEGTCFIMKIPTSPDKVKSF